MGYQQVLTGSVFGICLLTDIRQRRIYKSVVWGYLFLTLLGHVRNGTLSPETVLGGMVPGILCLMISWISRQGLGYGDSLLIAVCGISIGEKICAGLVLAAFFWSGIWALFLFRFARTNRKREMPFMPFLMLGMLVQYLFA